MKSEKMFKALGYSSWLADCYEPYCIRVYIKPFGLGQVAIVLFPACVKKYYIGPRKIGERTKTRVVAIRNEELPAIVQYQKEGWFNHESK